MNIESGMFIIGAFIGLTTGVIFSTAVDTYKYRAIIIEQGCGYYDTTTGDFKLKEK